MRRPAVVLGVPIDPLTMPETLDRIQSMVEIGRAAGKTHQVATVNVDFIVQALRDPELRYLLQRADLLTVDGMPLVWGLRGLGVPVTGRVTGADLVPALARRAAQCGLSIYLLGGMPGVAAKAAGLLKEKYPELKIAGVYSPPFSSIYAMDASFLEQIRSANPDILLVAFGNPKQEKWIGWHGRSLGVPVCIGVGGSLDFIAGAMRRAPVWMQRGGLEWLFRLLQEPRRLFRRYVIDLGIFAPAFLRQWLAFRPVKRRAVQPPRVALVFTRGRPVIALHGRITRDGLDAFQKVGKQALAASPHILVDLSQAAFIDCGMAGALVDLGNQAWSAGGELALAAVPARVLHLITLLKINQLFPIYPSLADGLAYRWEAHAAQFVPELIPVSGGAIPSGEMVLKGGRILDAATSQSLVETGGRLLQTSPSLICDLSETVFLTSAGLVALDQLRQMALQQAGEFKLINGSPDVMRVIQSAHFERLFSSGAHFPHAAE